jgi:hypothetical protein
LILIDKDDCYGKISDMARYSMSIDILLLGLLLPLLQGQADEGVSLVME